MKSDSTKLIAIFIFLSFYYSARCQLTLETIFLQPQYYPKKLSSLQFFHQQPIYAYLERHPNGSYIILADTLNKKTDSIIIAEIAIKNSIYRTNWEHFMVSNTDRYFLIQTESEYLYRHSHLSKYYIINQQKKMMELSTDKQMRPQFSPDDSKIAYIKSNNLYYKDLQTFKEVAITKDGKWNQIINGSPDWSYEEEFDCKELYQWNSKSDKIVYLKFDETQVKEYHLPKYFDLAYPQYFSYKYPKVNEENSKVSLWWYDLKKKKNYLVNIPYSFEFIPAVFWKKYSDEIVFVLLNRQQNKLQIVNYDINTKQHKILYSELSNTYVTMPTVNFLSDNSFILTSEKEGYNHLYHYDSEGKLLHQLTSGKYEVLKIISIDEKKSIVYYLANEENEIRNQLYAINYRTLKKDKLTNELGSHEAQFFSDNIHYIHTYSAVHQPPIIRVNNINTQQSVTVLNNAEIAETLAAVPKKEFIKTVIYHDSLNAWILKPKSILANQKYPLLIFVYGGPAHNEVIDAWQSNNDLFFSFLTENGYIVACLDNHGAGRKGAAFKKSVYNNLGKLEVHDQAAFAKQLSELSFVDADRIAIFGWSYGGFLAANCLMEANDIFKSAIAIAPITDWKLYNNIYTERYMQTPEKNPIGYHSYNPIVLADKLKGNLLLVHGTADDNVHFQHTIHLINQFNLKNKKYQLYLYPDKDHGLYGKTRFDLYTKMVDFLKEKL